MLSEDTKTPALGGNQSGQNRNPNSLSNAPGRYHCISRGATPELSEKDSLQGLSDGSREGGARAERSHALKPLVKWVGGKTQLLDEILRLIRETALERGISEEELDQLRYVEPFVGGAAVYWRVANERCLLADTCAPLINFYLAVQRDPELVGELLERMPSERSAIRFEQIRESFNNAVDLTANAFTAAQFVWLNKACFNGLWRTNRKGKFNVPVGKGSFSLPSPDDLRAAAERMRGTDFVTLPFQWVLQDCGRGDLVYVDPPYQPVKKGSFTQYSGPDTFTIDDHFELRVLCERAVERGAIVVVSNSDTPVMRDLWRNHKIRKVSARRSVNSKGAERGAVGELLIRVQGGAS